MFETPVAFFVFNRPTLTAEVFARIREVRPRRLLLIADGPRPEISSDAEKCARVREIISQVDWPAVVQTNFSHQNLGCGSRISSGLSWVFEQVEEAIVLEDDCLPAPVFFEFCAELLNRYREHRDIGIISGVNFVHPSLSPSHSYYFSQYAHIWGWATWRRTWQSYDFRLGQLTDTERAAYLRDRFDQAEVATYWDRTLQSVATGEVDTWDFQLSFASFFNSWLNIIPARNLVSNLGFGDDATHTRKTDHKLSRVPICEVDFPLDHPQAIVRWKEADDFTERHVFKIFPKQRTLRKRVKHAFRSARKLNPA